MKEVWKPIKGYEDLYEVSSEGNVRSLDRLVDNKTIYGSRKCFLKKGRILKPRTSKSRGLSNGYLRVRLIDGKENKNKCVHKLVAEAFIPNPENKDQVDHIDCNVFNNKVSNLRWCTQKENNNNPKTLERKRKAVFCVELNEKFESITIASEKTKTSTRTIYLSANSGMKKGKYRWIWHEKEDKKDEEC